MKKIKSLIRKWRKLKITDRIQIIQTIILLFTLMGAIYIGIGQNKISERLKTLQDYVSISVMADKDSFMSGEKNMIRLHNTGNINLYLWGLEIYDITKTEHDKPRLIAVGGDTWIYLTVNTRKKILEKKDFGFKLYLEDEFGQKWTSEHGGKVISSGETEEGNKKFTLALWSHKIEQSNWAF